MLVEDFVISSLPRTVIYLPDFISAQEESEILHKVYSVPKPKWTQLKNRRLQNWGGIPHVKGMIPEKIPEWLQKYIDKINALYVFKETNLPNHVLINEYLPGQGIMSHVDGPLFYPVISTINCGSHAFLRFHPNIKDDSEKYLKTECETFTLLLEPRSLLVLQHELYTDYMHGIDGTKADVVDDTVKNLELCEKKYDLGQQLPRTTRISLTIRNVPKCCSFKLKF